MVRATFLVFLTFLTACDGPEAEPCPDGLVEVFSGCGEPPAGAIFLPDACYEPCDPADDRCPTGSSCVNVWVDPCVCPEGEDCCDACGSESWLCAPGFQGTLEGSDAAL